jgi:hypothetical protein
MLVLAALVAFAIALVPTGSAKPPSPVGTYQACLIAGDGSAACTTATDDYSVLAGGNPELQVTITNNTASNQTLDYANVNVPTNAGVGLSIDTAHSPQPASYTTYASSSTSSQLQLRGLGLAPGASKTVAFFVNSTSASCTDGTWTTEARSSSTPSAFVFTNPPTKSSGLTSLVSVNCGLSFQSGPTAALPNKTITNAPYNPLGTSVTVVTQSLPVPLNGGGVSLSVNTGSFESGTDSFTGTGPVAFGSGSAAFGSLKATGTGGPFTLNASAAGFTPAVSSPPFAITKNGEACDPALSCPMLTGTDSNGKTLTQIATSAGFGFVGTSPTEVPFAPAPAGCQPWTPTPGVSGFAEFDGRTAAGTMTITYYVPQNAIKARYGKNVGQQFIPICIGAKTIDPVTHQAQDCSTPGDLGWTGDQLDPTTGAFTGQPAHAICGPGGYWWAIISSFQDKLDQSVNPVVTAWSSPTIGGTTYRAFVISVPSNLDMQGHG